MDYSQLDSFTDCIRVNRISGALERKATCEQIRQPFYYHIHKCMSLSCTYPSFLLYIYKIYSVLFDWILSLSQSDWQIQCKTDR